MAESDIYPDVSVIIATHNVRPYIQRTIESALSQSGISVEVIIIDDNSSDNTMEIVQAIQDSRLSCLQLDRNYGPSYARNIGIEKAKGSWIAILDGDDAFVADRLKECLILATKVSADIIVDPILTLNEGATSTSPLFHFSSFGAKDILKLSTFIQGNLNFLGGASLGYLKPIFSKKFLEEKHLRYDTSLRIGEDYLILAEALARGAICGIQEKPGYLYTRRTNSISHRISLDELEAIKSADVRFTSRHNFDEQTDYAQRRRTKSLNKAIHFTRLVTKIKERDIGGTLISIIEHPLTALNLWRPAFAGVKRTMAIFGKIHPWLDHIHFPKK